MEKKGSWRFFLQRDTRGSNNKFYKRQFLWVHMVTSERTLRSRREEIRWRLCSLSRSLLPSGCSRWVITGHHLPKSHRNILQFPKSWWPTLSNWFNNWLLINSQSHLSLLNLLNTKSMQIMRACSAQNLPIRVCRIILRDQCSLLCLLLLVEKSLALYLNLP